ncbi:MAG: hypothetical protein N2749_04660 [Clostridia bacterium]|nr:hypothetical protein [Clostridia bacterium]
MDIKNLESEFGKETIDLIKSAIRSKKEIKPEELASLMKKAKESENFVELLKSIDLSADKYRVICTLGDTELVYNDGEFYISDTMDINGKKKKKTKKEARDIYIEYYIQNYLNPLIEQKKIEKLKEKISKAEVKEEQKEKSKKAVSKVKQKIDTLTKSKKVKSQVEKKEEMER